MGKLGWGGEGGGRTNVRWPIGKKREKENRVKGEKEKNVMVKVVR